MLNVYRKRLAVLMFDIDSSRIILLVTLSNCEQHTIGWLNTVVEFTPSISKAEISVRCMICKVYNVWCYLAVCGVQFVVCSLWCAVCGVFAWCVA